MTSNALLYGEQYITIFDIDTIIQIDSVFIELDSTFVDSTFYIDSILIDSLLILDSVYVDSVYVDSILVDSFWVYSDPYWQLCRFYNL